VSSASIARVPLCETGERKLMVGNLIDIQCVEVEKVIEIEE
jgi:hypothetical protein